MSKKKREEAKSEDSHKSGKSEVEELRETLDGVQKEKDELLGKLQRVSADYANYENRMRKQIENTIGYEKERIIKTLLPVMDSFERTLQSAHSTQDVEVLVKGIRIVYDQLIDVLKSHNVEQIEALGQKFDPAVHQAMTQRTETDAEDNVVLEEFQRGYSLNGRVIRPSRVIVNKLAIEQAELPQEGEPDEDEDGAEKCPTAEEGEANDQE